MTHPTLLRYGVQIFDNMMSEPVLLWSVPTWFDVFPVLARALRRRTGDQIVIVKDYEAEQRCIVEFVDGCWRGRPA